MVIVAPAAGGLRSPPLKRASEPQRPGETRILQVIGDGAPGGGTTFVLNLVSALGRNGFEPVVMSQRGSFLLAEADRAGWRTADMSFSSPFDVASSVWRMAHQVKAIDPALIHVHGARAGLQVALSGVWKRIPVIYTVHGLHFHHHSGLRRLLGRSATALCLKHAHETVFVSESDRRFAHREGILRHANRYGVVHNAIPLADRQIGLDPKTHDIVYLGRLVPQKNPLFLADILAGLRPLTPSLCIVGSGRLEGELRRRIESFGLDRQVTWCGALDHEDALRQAAKARILLLPSLWEGHPLAVMEAMQLGLPVVASNVGGTDEIVIHGQTGFLASPDNVHEFASHIRCLLGDDRLRRRMAAAATRRLAEEFSFERHVSRHLELYERHLRRSDPP